MYSVLNHLVPLLRVSIHAHIERVLISATLHLPVKCMQGVLHKFELADLQPCLVCTYGHLLFNCKVNALLLQEIFVI